MAELTLQKQATEALKASTEVLVLVPADSTLDSAASSLALGSALEALGKAVTFLGPAGWPKPLERLGRLPPVVERLSAAEYLLKLAGTELVIDELGLEPASAGYQIRLKLRQGELSSERLSVEREPAAYDLILACGGLDLDGVMADADRLSVQGRPLLLISHRPPTKSSDEALACIEPNAASTAELLVGVLEALSGDQRLLNSEVATWLLLGLVSETEQFRKASTTSKSLTVAAQLISLGADQALVFGSLGQVRSFATLKLWGRLLARLQEEKSARLVWSYVTREDLELSGASEVDVPRVIDELLLSLEGNDHVVILLQHQLRIVGFIRRASHEGDALKLARRLEEPGLEISGDSSEAYCSLEGRLIDRGRELIAKLAGPPGRLEPAEDPRASQPTSSLEERRSGDRAA